MFKYNDEFEGLKKKAVSKRLIMEYVTLTCSREYCAVMFTVRNHAGEQEVSFGETADPASEQPLHEAVQEATILGLKAFFNGFTQEEPRVDSAVADVGKPIEESIKKAESTDTAKSLEDKKAGNKRVQRQGTGNNIQSSTSAGEKRAKIEPVFDMETAQIGESKLPQTDIVDPAAEKKGFDEPVLNGQPSVYTNGARSEVTEGNISKENATKIPLAHDEGISFTESDKEDFRLELGKYQQRGEVQREDNWISQLLIKNPSFITDILAISNPTLKCAQIVNRTKKYIAANDINLEEAVNRFNEQRKYA